MKRNTTSVMSDLWDVELEKGEFSNDIDRNQTGSNCSYSVHGGKMIHNDVTKTKLQLIRRKWRLQQQQMESHQKRKTTLIKEYETRREQRLQRSPGGMHLFKGPKGPKGTQIASTELRKIKVKIYRSIPGKSTANNDLQRDVVNPEDVVVKRREGEGSKPIFAREELKRAVSSTEEVEERRTVRTVKDANLENKSQTSKRRSDSPLTSNRSYSHGRTSFRCSRYEDYKRNDKENRRSRGGRSREREKVRQRAQSCREREEKRLNEGSRRDPSRSRERNESKLDRNSRHNKSIGGRSGERRMPEQIQQIPVPIYYGDFPPRPIIVGPLVPIPGHVAFGGSGCSMWPMRSFRPRFPPGIDMFRLRPSGNPREFGPQY